MKRIISLMLSVLMVLGILTLCVGAAGKDGVLTACGPVGFKDADRVTYTEAAAVTGGLGLFSGTTDGRFDPRGTVTRAQMATIVVKMLKGADFNADSYKGEENPFPDTAAFESGWAEGYVNACVQLGIVKGYGDGTFQPANPVTTAEALTMVLNALKVDAGAGEWPNTVMNKAAELKFADGLGFEAASDRVLNREQLAVIVSAGVQYKPEGGESLLASVFGVKTINTEHKYGETHCEVCRTAKPGLLTRADLEEAVVETAWAYFMKGVKLQYDSQVLNKAGQLRYGHYRVNEDEAPEFGTEHNTLYAVCSDYTCKCWWESLGVRVNNGKSPLDGLTDFQWAWSENQPERTVNNKDPEPISDKDIDYCVMRWMSKNNTFTGEQLALGLDQSPYFANFGDYHLTFANGYYPTTDEEFTASTEAVKAFLLDWEKNLRPGDLLCSDAHAMLYVGNGYILDCTTYSSLGGGKYDTKLGVDKIEPNGSVARLSDMDWLVSNYFGEKRSWFVVGRPTRALVVDDGDGILGNDVVIDPNFAIPEKTLSRMQFPGMEIDRTASVKPYNTIVSGENVTYTVKVSNKSDNELYVKYHTQGGKDYEPADYKALTITETVPAGTEFVSATGECKQENGKLSWTVDVPVGKTVEVSYTVKVTAPMGDTLVNDGGFVANIPSNSLTHTVGGKKPGEAQLAALAQLGSTPAENWREQHNVSKWTNDLDFAERLYQKMGIDLELPTLSDFVTNVFPWTAEPWKSESYFSGDNGFLNCFMINDAPAAEYRLYRDMLVENYWGGYYFFTGAEKKGTTVNKLGSMYMEPGDIMVYVTASVGGKPVAADIMVYAGKNTNGEIALLAMDTDRNGVLYTGADAEAKLWKAFLAGNDLFFVLRPSQAMEDINAKVFDVTKEPVYDAEPQPAPKPTQKGTTALSEANIAMLQSMNYDEVFGQKMKYAFNVYGEMGISGLDKVITNSAGKALTSGTNVLAVIAKRTDDQSSDVVRTYELNAAGTNNSRDMLVSNFYGGTWMDKNGTIPTVEQLQVGDIVVLGNRFIRTSDNKAFTDEIIAVYQGEGKFLMAGFYGCTRPDAYGPVAFSYKYGILDFSGETPTGEINMNSAGTVLGDTTHRVNDLTVDTSVCGYVKLDSFAHFFTNDPLTGSEWDFAFVLRPTQGVYDIQDLTYVPAN